MAKKVVCIVCGRERPGIPVKEDWVLNAMRWFKSNVTRNAQDNTLVVCKEDWPKYDKARRKFTTRRALYVALGVIFLIVGNIISFSFYTIIVTLAILLFFYLLSLLSYMPALYIKQEGEREKAQGKQKRQ